MARSASAWVPDNEYKLVNLHLTAHLGWKSIFSQSRFISHLIQSYAHYFKSSYPQTPKESSLGSLFRIFRQSVQSQPAESYYARNRWVDDEQNKRCLGNRFVGQPKKVLTNLMLPLQKSWRLVLARAFFFTSFFLLVFTLDLTSKLNSRRINSNADCSNCDPRHCCRWSSRKKRPH